MSDPITTDVSRFLDRTSILILLDPTIDGASIPEHGPHSEYERHGIGPLHHGQKANSQPPNQRLAASSG
jgi:hypothetical protein